ncbi:energy-coupling factor transporter ATPase [Calditerricola satsumensis]|uniref:Energy-coupling factor transporter ATP-binding protein EcfA n=1 Tax=Calditerricola satsumensis TaxID=373054 RepID=A0A8J3B7T2_9BACI|nr:energy-coupling factor transporter ATPase [Calditerricola satsumensis]GGK01902.1 energy-coupling factor transporter ATP-binding protein EcfA [Calditerricola satsumensis]
MQAAVVCEGVGYAYPAGGDGQPVWALRGVTLTVTRGEWVAIVGPNGSGKSTLAKLVAGLLLPAEGRVTVCGISTDDESRSAELRRRVAIVFQNPDNQLVAPTVEEDVAFGPENLGLSPEEIRRRVDEALRATGISALRQAPPHRLSGGQKQRLAIAGALAMEPEVLVLDEATAMLDPQGRREVWATVRRLHRERGLTILFITHRLEETLAADRIVVLADGRIVVSGPPRAVYANPARLEALGLDVPPVVALREALIRRGLPLSRDVLTHDELVTALWRLWSTA